MKTDAEDATVLVRAEGRALTSWKDVRLSRGMATLELRVESELVITGTVLDDNKHPVHGTELVFDRLSDDGRSLVDSTWRNVLGAGRTKSGPQGEFALRQLAAADYFITLTGPGALDRRGYAKATAGKSNLQIQFVQGDAGVATISGKFRDAVTRDSVYQAFVWLESEEPGRFPEGVWMPGAGFSEFQGEYTIEGVPPGRYRLCASEVGDAHAPWRGPITEFAAGRYEIDIDLMPARTLALRITTSSGEPVAGAAVRFVTAERLPFIGQAEPQGDRTKGVTDRYGEIVGTRLPATVIGVLVARPKTSNSDAADVLDPAFIDLATHSGDVVQIVVPDPSGG